MQELNQSCFCGHLLRAPIERSTGWCLECGMQLTLLQAHIQTLTAPPTAGALHIIAHLAKKAVSAEQQAKARTSRQPEDGEPAFVRADDLCDALNHLAQAFESWAYISARLWLLREQAKSQEQQTVFKDLHAWSMQQFQRLLALHFSMQTHFHRYCDHHHILVACKIVDQSLDLVSTYSSRHTPPMEATASRKEAEHAGV